MEQKDSLLLRLLGTILGITLIVSLIGISIAIHQLF
jgi:hypothetical protein